MIGQLDDLDVSAAAEARAIRRLRQLTERVGVDPDQERVRRERSAELGCWRLVARVFGAPLGLKSQMQRQQAKALPGCVGRIQP